MSEGRCHSTSDKIINMLVCNQFWKEEGGAGRCQGEGGEAGGGRGGGQGLEKQMQKRGSSREGQREGHHGTRVLFTPPSHISAHSNS